MVRFEKQQQTPRGRIAYGVLFALIATILAMPAGIPIASPAPGPN